MTSARDLPLDDRIRLLSGHDAWHTVALPPERLAPAGSAPAGVAAVTMSDGPHGLRHQADAGDHLGLGGSDPATCFPTAVTLASSWDEALVEEVGSAIGAEARAAGVDVVLGPGLNIKRHPFGGRNFEYFSEDPVVSGRMAAAMVRGLQSRGVGACLKHFAVNNQEGHRFVVDAVVDERTLRELYLAGFEHAVRHSRPWTVMAAYNSVNGEHATASRHLLTTILREEWGFDGLVMSDWGAVGDRVAEIKAGMDLEMPSSKGLYDASVRAAVADGTLSPDAVTRCAQRVMDLAAKCPTHTGTGRKKSGQTETAVDLAAHDGLARRAAAAGAVLLSNDGILPLAPTTRIALVGPFADAPRYQGAGSSEVNPTKVTSAADALREAGVDLVADPAEADVAVVMVGLPPISESEGFDRETLALPAEHDALVRAVAAVNPRTVVVVSGGAPVVLPWRDEVAAIVLTYLGGQASGGAVADLLLGRAEPGGRLAETFPARAQDVASDPWFPGQPHQVEHREGLFVGYRHHVSGGPEPLFPFGHGLGYTTWEWSDAALASSTVVAGDGATLTLRVTNTGERSGSDVVQVYLRDETGVVLRPARTLAGWTKVHLESGESREVEVALPSRAFEFYDVATGSWQVPAGAWVVEVARSSVDVVSSLPLTVSGGVTTSAEPPFMPRLAASDEDFARRLGREVPAPRPVRPFTRESTIGELSTTLVGAVFKRVMIRLNPVATESDDPTTRRMIERSVEEMPLRGAANFSAGRLRWGVVDTLLRLANGWSGLRRR